MSKTFKNLYPAICDFENLYRAHRQARRGGKRKRPAVAEFEHNFLGWRVFPHYRRLRRDNLRHAVRRLRRQQAQVAAGELPLEKLSQSVQAWIAHLEHGQTYHLRRRILGQFAFKAP